MSIRSDILDALEDGLRGISVASGYNTELGNAFEYWQTEEVAWQSESLTYRDSPPSSPELYQEANARTEHTLPVEVEAVWFVPTGTDPRAHSERVLQDVLAVVDQLKGGLPGGARVQVSQSYKEIARQGQTAVLVMVLLTFVYQTRTYAV